MASHSRLCRSRRPALRDSTLYRKTLMIDPDATLHPLVSRWLIRRDHKQSLQLYNLFLTAISRHPDVDVDLIIDGDVQVSIRRDPA